MAHKKYRCADYTAFETMKDARKHASELSRGVNPENKHISLLIYVCVDCEAFYAVYLPYTPKVREKAVKHTAEIIEFPKARTVLNPGLILERRAA